MLTETKYDFSNLGKKIIIGCYSLRFFYIFMENKCLVSRALFRQTL